MTFMKKSTLKSPYIKAIVKINNNKVAISGYKDDIFNAFPNQEIIVLYESDTKKATK